MMKFTKDSTVYGTSLQGYVPTTYDRLVEVFGEPDTGPNEDIDGKVTCEWRLDYEDGTVATIYDWKVGETPFCEYEWHVGGKSFEAVSRVLESLGLVDA